MICSPTVHCKRATLQLKDVVLQRWKSTSDVGHLYFCAGCKLRHLPHGRSAALYKKWNKKSFNLHGNFSRILPVELNKDSVFYFLSHFRLTVECFLCSLCCKYSNIFEYLIWVPAILWVHYRLKLAQTIVWNWNAELSSHVGPPVNNQFHSDHSFCLRVFKGRL